MNLLVKRIEKNGSFFLLFIAILFIYYVLIPKTLLKYYYFPTKTNSESKSFFIENKVNNIYITTPDGAKLDLWLVKAKNNNPTVIFCHGDSGNISDYKGLIKPLSSIGYGLVMFDYRGFGNSSGNTDEHGVYTDLKTVLQYLKQKQKINEKSIILWGYSFGGAVVSEVAANNNFRGVILHSTFTNAKEMRIYEIERTLNAKEGSFSDFIIKKIVNSAPLNEFDTKNKIKYIKSPLLIAHDIPDEVVPVKMSYELFQHKQSANLFISNKGSHRDFSWIMNKFIDYIKKLK